MSKLITLMFTNIHWSEYNIEGFIKSAPFKSNLSLQAKVYTILYCKIKA